MADVGAGRFVKIDVEDRVGWLTLDDPKRLNPVTPERIEELNLAVEVLAADERVAVVVVTGAGRGFCSGADLSRPATGPLPPASGSLVGRRAQWTLTSLPQPVIAMVNGPAIGYGCELALQADLRIAGASASFGLPFVHLGSVSDTGAGSWLLPRLVGVDHAADMLYSGRVVQAAEAERRGLVTRVFDDDDLRVEVSAMARAMAQGSAWSLRAMKDLLWSGLEQRRGEHLAVQHRYQIEGDPDHDIGAYVGRFKERPTIT